MVLKILISKLYLGLKIRGSRISNTISAAEMTLLSSVPMVLNCDGQPKKAYVHCPDFFRAGTSDT